MKQHLLNVTIQRRPSTGSNSVKQSTHAGYSSKIFYPPNRSELLLPYLLNMAGPFNIY